MKGTIKGAFKWFITGTQYVRSFPKINKKYRRNGNGPRTYRHTDGIAIPGCECNRCVKIVQEMNNSIIADETNEMSS